MCVRNLRFCRIAARGARVSMVDPRERRPCEKELEVIYAEQVRMQRAAVARVERSGREVEKLLEDRMKARTRGG